MNSSKNETKPKIGTIVGLLLFAGMVLYLIVTGVMHDRLENDLSEERLKSELLLSEKLSEQKENVQLKNNMKQIADKYVLTNSSLESTLEQLTLTEGELKKARSAAHAALIQKQRDQIQTLQEKIKRDSLVNEIKLNQAKAYSSALEKTISNTASESALYIHEIERLKRLGIYDLKIETLRKNGRLTFKASKTKTIKVNLEISNQVEQLSFQIIDSSGKKLQINETNSSLVIRDNHSPGSVRAFIVSTEIQLKAAEKFKTVELTYTSTDTLTPGIYKIILLSGLEIIGNCLLRLE